MYVSHREIYFAYCHSIMKYGIILPVIHPSVKRYSLYKRKLLKVWLVQNLKLHVEACLGDYIEISFVPSE